MSGAWSSAEAYDRFVGRYGAALADALMDAAGVRPGMRALDVGCGPGALTRRLAKRLGPECVAAAEPSEPFAAACRERVPGAEVVVAAAEALPFPDDAFDATLAQLVVNFMADAHAGVREMARVTRPGGVGGAAVWDYGGEMTLLRAFWDAAAEVARAGASDRDEGRRMPYCTPDELGALWREAFDDVRVQALEVAADYEDFDGLWEPLERGVGPAGSFTVSLEPPARAALRAGLHRRLGSPSGPFRLTARAWCAVGSA